MKTLKICFTRPDKATKPGGIILREHEHFDGSKEYIAHSFSRAPGSKEPNSFFWGRYHRTFEAGIKAYNEKVATASQYTTGGSLIGDHELERELAKELEASTTSTIQERVKEALSNASENGYDFKGWTTQQIAEDMIMCDSSLEDEEVDNVVKAIEEVREKSP